MRVMAGEKRLEPAGCGSEAVHACGRRRRGQMERAPGANGTMGWHRQRAGSEETLLSGETESIRTEREDAEGKLRT